MKRFLKYIPLLASAVFCLLGFVACAPAGLEAHSFSSEWTSNINYHWHVCKDPGCNERGGYEKHHWEVTTVYEEAGCGTNGAGQYTCADCKATLGNTTTPATIPATGDHDYQLDSVDVEPTCGEEGYGSYICSQCNDYVVMPIEATGEHDYSGAYTTTSEGHYHVCKNGCGVDEEIKPHVMGEGKRFEPVGSQDGRIEYRCKECNYLMKTEPIESPNILHHFEVKFVKMSMGATTSEVAVPYVGDDGELYVRLKQSTNASNGYKIEITGYNASGNVVSAPSPTLYYYNPYTAQRKKLNLQSGCDASTGYLGYIENSGFYVSRVTEDECLLIECVQSGREPVTLLLHVTTKAAPEAAARAPLAGETLYFEDKKKD